MEKISSRNLGKEDWGYVSPGETLFIGHLDNTVLLLRLGVVS